MVIGELNMVTLHESRTTGTVLPLNDSMRTSELVAKTRVTSL